MVPRDNLGIVDLDDIANHSWIGKAAVHQFIVPSTTHNKKNVACLDVLIENFYHVLNMVLFL